jgi:Tfp pilus assembly protein PilF
MTGTAYFEKGEYARGDYEKALQIDPNYAYAQQQLEALQNGGH